MSDLLDTVIRAMVAELIASVPSGLYGDGTADLTYSEDTTLTASVYARSIAVQPGVVLTISTSTSTPIFLYARERIWNRGFIRSNGSPASGATGGGSGDYAGASGVAVARAATPPIYLLSPTDFTAYFTAGAPGSGGTVPSLLTTSGLDWRGTNVPAWSDIHTPNQFYARLEDPDQFYRLQGGSAGVQTPDTVGGAGGEAGGFIGLIAPEIDNWDGVIEAKGGAGSNQTGGVAVTAWAVATAYAIGANVRPITPSGLYYQAIYPATSHATVEPTWPTALGTTISPTYVAGGTNPSADNATVTPGLPAGLADNDLMLAQIVWRNNTGTIGTPAGWTLYGNHKHATGDLQVSVYYRLRQSGDGAPAFTVSGGSAGDWITGRLVAYRGVDTTTPIHASGGFSPGTTTADVGPIAAPETIPAGLVIVLAGIAAYGAPGIAPLTGDGLTWVEATDVPVATAGAERHLVLDYAATPAAVAMTNKTFVVPFTPSGSTAWIGLALTLRPLLGTSSVDDNGIRWDNMGAEGSAGGGGGGYGGVVAAICREWNGGAPILTGGAAGTGLSTGGAGVAGGEGYWVKVVDR